ncbi:MAG TPA: hypothetical protein PK957_04955, partial [Candidatus Dojkabacteria bacterium]|nr:hypothetical protein [Candidatus Dojkabacteria bacterium]
NKKIVRTRLNKTNEEKIQIKEKISRSMKIFMESRTEEYKEQVSRNKSISQKEYWNNLSDDEKQERIRLFMKQCPLNGSSKFLYQNISYRSPLEVFVAEILTNLNLKFKYEDSMIKMENGKRHIPDFYIPKYNLFIESKGRSFEPIESVLYKKEQAIKQGYNYEIVYYDTPEKLMETITQILTKYE